MSVPLTATQSPSVPLSQPSLLFSLLPVLALVITVSGAVYLFGEDASGGPIQIALFIAAGVAMILAVKSGKKWKELEEAIAGGVSVAINALLILLMIGAVIGSWIVSGTVPALIYYGLKLIDPSAFYVTTCIVCSLGALSIGSSWSVIGTLGLGLFGVATSLGLSPEITAGAIISGAYFGDKLSPLSDTTNLAAAVTETELFEHIRFLLWTTIPAFAIALIVFTYFSLTSAAEIDQSRITEISASIAQSYNLTPWLLAPLIMTLGLAASKNPAFTSLLLGAVTAAIVGLLTQTQLIEAEGFIGVIKNIWLVSANGYTAVTGNEMLDSLLSRGGMDSMLNTVWLIMSAMFFGGMMEKSGALSVIVRYLLIGVHTGSALIRRAGLTSLAANLVTSDQYLAIALPSRMYADKFSEMNLQSKNLSRALEDYGTVTSVLIPWNTCGAFFAATLGIATSDYLLFCVFNLASPIISYIYALANFKIETITATDV